MYKYGILYGSTEYHFEQLRSILNPYIRTREKGKYVQRGGEHVAIALKDQLLQELLQSPFLRDEAGSAVEGWVTTGSRRLSKETK